MGLMLLLMGWLVRRYPPRKGKAVYGYHSYASNRNEQTWEAANRYAADISLILSYIMIPLGGIMGLAFDTRNSLFTYSTIGSAVLAVLLMRGFTERFLYQNFDPEGSPKVPEDQGQKT